MQQNVGALIAVAADRRAGRLADRSPDHYSRTLACIEAGHRNCVPLDYPAAAALVAGSRSLLSEATRNSEHDESIKRARPALAPPTPRMIFGSDKGGAADLAAGRRGPYRALLGEPS
jgi:hypothetical protein